MNLIYLSTLHPERGRPGGVHVRAPDVKPKIHKKLSSKDMNYSLLSVILNLEVLLNLEGSVVLRGNLRGNYLSLYQPIFQKPLRPVSVH